MPLVTAQNFQLTPDILGSFSRGSQAVGQFRTQQLQEKILQDQLQQQQAQQQQAAQRQAMLGQIFGGQQQQSIPGATPPISGATPPISPVDGFGTGARAQPQAAGGLMPPQPAAPRGTGMASDQALAEFAARFPDQFEQVNKNLGLIDSRRKSEAARRAFEIEQAPVEQRPELINAQAQALRAQGRDPSDTLSLLNLPPEQQNAALKTVQIAALPNEKRLDLAQGKTASIKAGVDAEGPGFFAVTTAGAERIPGAIPQAARGASVKSFAPVTLVNPAGEKMMVTPTFDPTTGQAKLAPFTVPAGFEVSKETPEEKRSAEILAEGQKAIQKVTGKGQAERRQLAIDRGVEAADSFANVQRSLDLLDLVETGGVDAASLRAQQLFGIEGANEAELSNRLGKAVLSQLKATFGSAFTEEEGERLERLEAGFGKSVAGNRRILEQTKQLIQRVAKRGLRAARAEGDDATVKDIEEALAFRFTGGPQKTPPPPPPGFVVESQ